MNSLITHSINTLGKSETERFDTILDTLDGIITDLNKKDYDTVSSTIDPQTLIKKIKEFAGVFNKNENEDKNFQDLSFILRSSGKKGLI